MGMHPIGKHGIPTSVTASLMTAISVLRRTIDIVNMKTITSRMPSVGVLLCSNGPNRFQIEGMVGEAKQDGTSWTLEGLDAALYGHSNRNGECLS